MNFVFLLWIAVLLVTIFIILAMAYADSQNSYVDSTTPAPTPTQQRVAGSMVRTRMVTNNLTIAPQEIQATQKPTPTKQTSDTRVAHHSSTVVEVQGLRSKSNGKQ